MRRLLVLWALAMGAAACDDDPAAPGPVPGYPHALATRSCGPTDGPAMTIFLTTTETQGIPPSAPYFQIFLTRSPAELEGRLWAWPGGEGVASGAECPTPGGPCSTSPYGVVSLGRFGADSSLEVTVDLRRANGERLAGRATARWITQSPLFCG